MSIPDLVLLVYCHQPETAPLYHMMEAPPIFYITPNANARSDLLFLGTHLPNLDMGALQK